MKIVVYGYGVSAEKAAMEMTDSHPGAEVVAYVYPFNGVKPGKYFLNKPVIDKPK